MDRLKRLAALPVALLLVLSVSGVAGASALISFSGPAASALEHSAVAQAVRAALGVEDDDDADDDTDEAPDGDEESGDADEGTDDADQAPDGDEDGTEADAEDADEEDAAPTEEELAECAGDGDVEDLQRQEGESHGDYVSRVAKSDAVGGPNDNHGFCVSAAARGLFDELSEDGTEEEPVDEEETSTPMDEDLAECAGDGDPEELKQQADESHGDYVSRVAKSDAVGGPKDNHGFCVSAAARGLFGEAEDEGTAEDADAEACEAVETEEPATDVEDEDVDDAEATCSEEAKAKAKADKAAEKAERKADKAKDKADRKAEKAKQKSERKAHGMGNGRGKGKGRGR